MSYELFKSLKVSPRKITVHKKKRQNKIQRQKYSGDAKECSNIWDFKKADDQRKLFDFLNCQVKYSQATEHQRQWIHPNDTLHWPEKLISQFYSTYYSCGKWIESLPVESRIYNDDMRWVLSHSWLIQHFQWLHPISVHIVQSLFDSENTVCLLYKRLSYQSICECAEIFYCWN